MRAHQLLHIIVVLLVVSLIGVIFSSSPWEGDVKRCPVANELTVEDSAGVRIRYPVHLCKGVPKIGEGRRVP